jgi:hypothetical protein
MPLVLIPYTTIPTMSCAVGSLDNLWRWISPVRNSHGVFGNENLGIDAPGGARRRLKLGDWI